MLIMLHHDDHLITSRFLVVKWSQMDA